MSWCFWPQEDVLFPLGEQKSVSDIIHLWTLTVSLLKTRDACFPRYQQWVKLQHRVLEETMYYHPANYTNSKQEALALLWCAVRYTTMVVYSRMGIRLVSMTCDNVTGENFWMLSLLLIFYYMFSCQLYVCEWLWTILSCKRYRHKFKVKAAQAGDNDVLIESNAWRSDQLNI